jgi:hypothetical protein
MRSQLAPFVALLALAASCAAMAENGSSSGGGGSSAGSAGGGGHAGGGGGGGGSHGGGGGGHGFAGSGHGSLGNTYAERSGIGIQSLGRGSFAQALGNHGAVPTAAKAAVAARTAAAGDSHHHDHDHHYRLHRFAFREMPAIWNYCVVPRFDRNDVEDLEFVSRCGGSFKARINPQTGQPIG